MEQYVKLLKEYLEGKRNYTKTMFKITGTLFRGVSKGRFTYNEGLAEMYKLGGNCNVHK